MNPSRTLTILLCAGALAAGDAPDLSVAQLPRIDGETLHADVIELSRYTLNDASAKPNLANQVLTLTDCHANAYGGTIAGTITLDFKTNRTRCELTLRDLDLAAVTAELGGSADNVAGKLTGTIDISFPTGKPEDAAGHGAVAIRDGNLVELSWLTNLLVGDLSNVRGKDEADAGFTVANGLVTLTHATIKLPKTSILISGTVSLAGDLRLLVIPHSSGGVLGNIPLVGQLFGNVMSFASSRVARAVVRGHVSKPVVVLNPFAD